VDVKRGRPSSLVRCLRWQRNFIRHRRVVVGEQQLRPGHLIQAEQALEEIGLSAQQQPGEPPGRPGRPQLPILRLFDPSAPSFISSILPAVLGWKKLGFDTELLKRGFLGWLRGERGHCSMARVPTMAEEDAKRPNRERDCLVGECTRASSIKPLRSTPVRRPTQVAAQGSAA
jgi:hypothetical protein